MKRALLVGIDDYDDPRLNGLDGCVNDVNALIPLLSRNEDNSPNLNCQTRTSGTDRVDRRNLLQDIDSLLAPGADVALLYFAGHGAEVENDVVLVTQDGSNHDFGVPLSTVLARVQGSPVREVLLILDAVSQVLLGACLRLAVTSPRYDPGYQSLRPAGQIRLLQKHQPGEGCFPPIYAEL